MLGAGIDIDTAFDGAIPSGGSGGSDPEVYEEQPPGNVIRYNDDDEDGDGTPDYDDEDPLQQADTALEWITVGWNDLGVVLKDFSFSFAQSEPGTLKVWDTQKKEHELTDAVFTLDASGGATASVAGVEPLCFSGNTFFVEGCATGEADLSWVLKYSPALGGGEVGRDTVLFTVLKVNLTIHDGQDGEEVPELEEETRGAFTVANWNDTDGDGVTDAGDTDGVVANAVNPVVGEDEVDLMRLVLHKPTPDLGGTIRLWVHPAAAVRLWAESTKITPIPINPQGGFGYGFVDFPVSELDKTVWVELITPSTQVRDYSLSMEYHSLSDSVKATAVWASLTSSEFGTLDAPDVFNEYPDMDSLTKDCVEDVGGTGIRPFDWGTLHNAGVMQFTVMPAGIEDEVNAPLVNFDVARRQENARWYWKGDVLLAGPARTDPDDYLPDYKDEANDDPHELDETLWPTQLQHMYSMDSPGLPSEFWPSEEGSFDHIRFVANFWEYVLRL